MVSRIKNLGSARNDDQIGDARRLERGRFRPGRRVDHRQVDVLFGGGLDRVFKPQRLDISHYGSGLLSPVPPAAGARLWVGIQYDDRPTLAHGFDRQRKSNARLADTAFLREQGYDLHGWHTALQCY